MKRIRLTQAKSKHKQLVAVYRQCMMSTNYFTLPNTDFYYICVIDY